MELLPFPKHILTMLSITSPNSEYLVEVGLPSWCAPHLYFGDFEGVYLPQLKAWEWRREWMESYDTAVTNYPLSLVLGTAEHDEPIVLLPNKPEVFVFDTAGEKLQFLNSSISSLGLVLSLFANLVELSVSKDQNSVVQKMVPKVLVNNFIDELHRIETRNSLWVSWAEQLSIKL